MCKIQWNGGNNTGWVSDTMVKQVDPLSAMVWPLEKFDLYKFGQFYINRHITDAKLHKF